MQDLMQMSHDIEQLQRDLGMFMEFMEADEIRTILKIERDE